MRGQFPPRKRVCWGLEGRDKEEVVLTDKEADELLAGSDEDDSLSPSISESMEFYWWCVEELEKSNIARLTPCTLKVTALAACLKGIGVMKVEREVWRLGLILQEEQRAKIP